MAKKTKKSNVVKQVRKTESKWLIDLPEFRHSRYIVPSLFLMLALIYFAPVVFGSNSMQTTEGVFYGYGDVGGSLDDFENPFKEDHIWTTMLGGMPASEGLNEYNMRFFWSLFRIFFYDFRANGLYLTLLVFFSGLSMFTLLRTLGVSRTLAAVLGAGFMFSPHFLSLIYAGHLSKMGVIAITSLMLAFLIKGLNSGAFKHFIWLGLIIGLDIFFAHLQMVHFSLLAIGLFYLMFVVNQLINKEYSPAMIRTGLFVLAVILGLGVGARGFIPQYLYTKTDSKRASSISDEGASVEGVGIDYASSWGLHAEEIASLFVPEFVSYANPVDRTNTYWGKNALKGNSEYFSGVILLLAFASIIYIKRRREVLYLFILMILGILFTLGKSSPVWWFAYYVVPGVKSFRAPSLMIFVSALSAFTLAGIVLQSIVEDIRSAKKISYLLFGFAGICLIGAIAPEIILNIWRSLFYPDLAGQKLEIFRQNIPNLSSGFLISAILSGITGAGLYMISLRKLQPLYFFIALLPLLLFDQIRVSRDFFNYFPITVGVDPFNKKEPAYEFLKEMDPLDFRVMPAYARHIKDKVSYAGLYFLNGFHDFTMKRYDTVINLTMQNNNQTLPLWMKISAVKYVVYPAQQAPPNTLFKDDRLAVVENGDAFPYLYVRYNTYSVDTENKALEALFTGKANVDNSVIIEEQLPAGFESMADELGTIESAPVQLNTFDLPAGDVKLEVSMAEKGFLVFSENFHSGWECTVDGEPVKIYRANYIYQGVFIDAGDHSVDFRFKNPVIDLSRKIMFGSMLLIVGLLAFIYIPRKDEKNTLTD